MKKLEVIWTAQALTELDIIFEYYFPKSPKAADKIIAALLSRTEQLAKFSFSGQEEALLKKLKLHHRYLVQDNYKIIFYVTSKAVYITDVFDTRRNPKKIIKK